METFDSNDEAFDPSEKFLTWPDSDESYMKIIRKSPTKQHPYGFHVLGTRYHPIGDFDTPEAILPNEPLRIYQTKNGFRVFFTGRYDVDRDAMFDELDAMGGDMLYSKFGKSRRYFASRIEPKTLDAPRNHAVTKLLSEIGTPLPQWRQLIEYHDSVTNAYSLDAILV
jgi:hypothetical protein